MKIKIITPFSDNSRHSDMPIIQPNTIKKNLFIGYQLSDRKEDKGNPPQNKSPVSYTHLSYAARTPATKDVSASYPS